MTDQFASYLTPGTWLYWPPNPGVSAPPERSGPQSFPMAANLNGGLLGSIGRPAGGILGNLAGPLADTSTLPRTPINASVMQTMATMPSAFFPAQPQNGWTQDWPSSQAANSAVTRNAAPPAHASDQLHSWESIGGAATREASRQPSTQPNVPFYGPGDVLLPPPEPAAPPPPKDFRTRLREALSDESTRYYLGPHLFDVLRKVHALTQLLPGSGMVQSTQDTSLAKEEARAGNYGKAAAHLGMGAVNAALDWLPPAKLAIIGGTMAKTFPWHKLSTALEMEAAGKSADEIWRATGLGRDAAGNWIYEISDRGYYVRTNADKPTVSVAPLYEDYVHPGMQEAYPGLSNWRSQLTINPLEERQEA